MNKDQIEAWLWNLARDVEAAGDMQFARLDDEGVTPNYIALSEELRLIAKAVAS